MKNHYLNSLFFYLKKNHSKFNFIWIITAICCFNVFEANAISIVFPSSNPTAARICEKPNFEISFNSLPTNQIHTIQCLFEVRVGSVVSSPILLTPSPLCDGVSSANEIVDLTISSNGITTSPTNQLSSFVVVPNTQSGLHEFSLGLKTQYTLVNVNMNYGLQFDCSLIPQGVLSGQKLYIRQIWTINGSITATSPDLEVTYGSISAPTNLNFDASYKETVDLYFEYTNNGFNDLDLEFDFINNACSSNAPYVVLATKWAKGDINTIRPPLSQFVDFSIVPFDNKTTLGVNEKIHVLLRLEVTDCLTNCNNNSVDFRWRCMDVNTSILCNDCQQVFHTNYTLNQETNLDFTVEYTNNTNNTNDLDNTCVNDEKEWEVLITNTNQHTTYANANFTLDANAAKDFFTLIDNSKIVIPIQTQNGTPISKTSTFASTNTVNCLSNPSHSLKELNVSITDFKPGDSFKLKFTTQRCCSEDDQFLNVNKQFNIWNFSAACTTKCNTIVSPSINDLGKYGPNSKGISSNAEIGTDINQATLFTTSIHDLTVGSGANYGTSASDFEIDIKGLIGDVGDLELFGSNMSNNPFMDGILRVTINTQKGLIVNNLQPLDISSDLMDDVWISQPNQTLNWTPLCYFTDNTTNDCEPSEYNFYFKMSDLTVDPLEYFTNSKFHFNLLQCCSALAQTDYSIRFSLLANEDCFSFIPNTNFGIAPICNADNGGACCWLPLNEEERFVNVHCPGCKAPGIIVDSYTLERTSFGFEDLDDDGRADNTTVINPSTYSKKVNKNASVHG
jgi:hypothetical protein